MYILINFKNCIYNRSVKYGYRRKYQLTDYFHKKVEEKKKKIYEWTWTKQSVKVTAAKCFLDIQWGLRDSIEIYKNTYTFQWMNLKLYISFIFSLFFIHLFKYAIRDLESYIEGIISEKYNEKRIKNSIWKIDKKGSVNMWWPIKTGLLAFF